MNAEDTYDTENAQTTENAEDTYIYDTANTEATEYFIGGIVEIAFN